VPRPPPWPRSPASSVIASRLAATAGRHPRSCTRQKRARSNEAAITLRELFWERWAKVPRPHQWPQLLALFVTVSRRAVMVRRRLTSSARQTNLSHGTLALATILDAWAH
jgi:hypothetical protein